MLVDNQANIDNYINNIDLVDTVTQIQCNLDSTTEEPVIFEDSSFSELLSNLNVTQSKQSNILSFLGNVVIPSVYEKELAELVNKYYNNIAR